MNYRTGRRLALFTAFCLLLAGFGFADWIRAAEQRAHPPVFGVTFAPSQARYLGQDPRHTFALLLDDLGVRLFRLSAYWNVSEPVAQHYDFSEIDWQIAAAEQRGARVILAVGRRLPRWPECHDPSWLSSLNAAEERDAQLSYVRAAIEHLRSSRAIAAWQVENEPFFKSFGECPPPDAGLVRDEIALVRSLDPRPVVVTESGELSTWRHAAALADVVGVSLYRITHSSVTGYMPYLLTPNFYAMHADLVALLTGKRTVITELQMEPWVAEGITAGTVEEMYHSLSPEQFAKNARFAEATGLSPVYLWGAEWWLWMKEKQNEPAFWDAARALFRS